MTSRRRQRRAALAFLALCAATFAACSQSTPPPRSILLISLDTLRPDHLGAYGYERKTSKHLDALAAQGVLFETAVSPAPWTLPSHTSMLTGLYPSHHGMTETRMRLPASLPTLAARLQRAGFATAAIVNSSYLSERHGLDRGFEVYEYVREAANTRAPTRLITDRAVAWLRENRDRRRFLFLHYYDAHSDYTSYDEFEARYARPYTGKIDGTTAQLIASRHGGVPLGTADGAHLIDLYDAGIAQLDEEIGRLLDLIESEGLAEETLLIVTSDHGEEFLEHGSVLHGRTQFDEVLRVPLLMRGPGLPAGLRLREAVSLVDLLPTLLSFVGLPLDFVVDGVDLSPLWLGGEIASSRVLFGEADHGREVHDVTRSARRGRYKLHYNRETKERVLYDLERDPGEHAPLDAEAYPELRELGESLEAFMGSSIAPPAHEALTEDEIEHLRSLGYLVE